MYLVYLNKSVIKIYNADALITFEFIKYGIHLSFFNSEISGDDCMGVYFKSSANKVLYVLITLRECY